MKFPRSSGILLHPTSLPGRYGIGDLGAEAYRFAHFLKESGVLVWQVLPLGPTGYGDSPYQCFSAFAGNPLLISLEVLAEQGLLSTADLSPPEFPPGRVDYEAVIRFKLPLLRRAFENFKKASGTPGWSEFERFCEEEKEWVEEYALFRAIKSEFGEQSWIEWDESLIRREPAALERYRILLSDELAMQRFFQFQFFQQWSRLKEYCSELGLTIMGDIPLFVAHDSVDVWANQEFFLLDEKGNPTSVAGVPPDYFSATGQLWGNPVYRWDRMQADDFSWWLDRIRATVRLVDLIRLDHFRGFEAYWQVLAGEETAINGNWVKVPGAKLFERLRQDLGELPLVAENLGWITPEVEELRTSYKLPGMAILQFAFGTDPQAATFIPHNLTTDVVLYTGTHDNDTVMGWWKRTAETDPNNDQETIDQERDLARRYLNIDGGDDPAWAFIRAAFSSVARLAIVPVQDVLSLDNSARLNRPGQPAGNWQWRLQPGQLTEDHGERLREFAWLYGRRQIQPVNEPD